MLRSYTLRSLVFATLALVCSLASAAHATEADSTTITIDAKTAGVTPFISQFTLTASDTSVIRSVQFSIQPKTGSVTRPLSGTYDRTYLLARGDLQTATGKIFLAVYGLYAGFNNTVTLTYAFNDGSTKSVTTTFATAGFDDPCDYDKPTVLQARTESALSYDFIMIKGSCDSNSPAVIDTDGALRWVGPGGFSTAHATFFDNAFYIAQDTSLYRMELDGSVSFLHDYSDIGVVSFHHNIDRGKVGLILDVNTAAHKESLNLEVDAAGNVVKMWDMVDIISQAMTAGGDDPSQFVVPSSEDWFHNNAVAYNRIDDSLVLSSRENFVICLDYKTLAIKWILGDTTKEWYLYPSLNQYALTLSPGSLPPIGQHAVSITYDEGVMVFDNGKDSDIQVPAGIMRDYASPRKWQIDLPTMTATEVWSYEMGQTLKCGICASVYEDQPLNYLIDYADVNGPGAPVQYTQFLGLDAAGEKVFYYQYPNLFCATAFNAIPIHLESTKFPTVGPQALNLSTRGRVGVGDNSLIGGLIIGGFSPKTVVLRGLGPSLSGAGVAGALANPVLQVFDATGTSIAVNDNWQTDAGAAQIEAEGLAPESSLEAATLLTLPPAAYTVVVTGRNATTGVGLVEAYDTSPNAGSRLANISTRGSVGVGDDVLISGFIVGDVASAAVVIRALGPTLPPGNVDEPLNDPTLTVFDANGALIAENDNWQEDNSAEDIAALGLAPAAAAESATALFLPAGAYSAIVAGANGGTGVGLVEVYHLD